GVIELRALPDDDRTGADDQNSMNVVTTRHGAKDKEKGSPEGLPCPSFDDCCSNRGGLSARRALDLAGVQAARADLDLLDLPIELDAGDLKIRPPGAARLVVRVRNVVSEGDAFAAGVALVSFNGHGSALHQLDARHLRPITLAVRGLENA